MTLSDVLVRFKKTAGISLFAAFVAAGPASAEALKADQDMFIGKADAPVTVIEYASMTCPHCANFHTDELPAIKKAYIDTGKVKLVFREFPLDRVAYWASILARCAGKDRYFAFIDILFKRQRAWATAENPQAALAQFGQMGGVSQDQFKACLADKALGDGILKTRLDGQNKFEVNLTPSFVINGNKHAGAMNVDALAKIVDPLLK